MAGNRAEVAITRAHGSAGSTIALPAAIVAGMVVIYLLSTRHGIGIWPDSVGYLQLGVIRHFSPLYTWMLEAVAALGLDIADAAKLLGLALAAANAFLIWRIALMACGGIAPALVATALIILSPLFILLHSLAMTEPLFLALTMIALFPFARGAASGDRRLLISAGVIVGISMLARFAGAATLGAMCVASLMVSGRTRLARIIDSASIGTAGSAIFLGWAMLSHLTTGQSTGREFALNGNVDAARLLRALDAAATSLMPPQLPQIAAYGVLGAAVAGASLTAFLYAKRRMKAASSRNTDAMILFCGAYCIIYVAFIALSVTIESNLPINGRYLFPLYVFGVLGCVAAFGALDLPPKPARMGLLALGAVVVVSHSVRAVINVATAYRDGIGYANVSWNRSPIMEAIAALPAAATIYTNGPDAVAFVIRRCADYLPVKVNRFTGKEERDNPYGPQLARMDANLNRPDTYVAFIDRITWRFYLPREQELVDTLKLTLLDDTGVGRIYGRAIKDRRRHSEPAAAPEWRPGFGGCTCAIIQSGSSSQCR